MMADLEFSGTTTRWFVCDLNVVSEFRIGELNIMPQCVYLTSVVGRRMANGSVCRDIACIYLSRIFVLIDNWLIRNPSH